MTNCNKYDIITIVIVFWTKVLFDELQNNASYVFAGDINITLPATPRWRIFVAADGKYRLSTKQQLYKTMECKNSATADNTAVQVSTFNGSSDNNQLWYITPSPCAAWTFNSLGNGAATEYNSNIELDNPNVNCYLYAIGYTQADKLKFYNDKYEDGLFRTNAYEVPSNANTCLQIEKDYLEKTILEVYSNIDIRERDIRSIESATTPIESDEFRFCIRTGCEMMPLGNGLYYYSYDYHFMVQTKTGEWAQKQGWYNAAQNKGYIDPSEINWSLLDYNNFYDSKTYFFACTR